MIYILRTLWAIGSIPVHLFNCLIFAIGLLIYPIVCGIYYIIHGTNDDMKWEVDTMAYFVSKKYSNLKDLIEKQK